ncbi:hypothetical protein DFH06DRAFT_756897 [Mycena polygramma]|nr:hypothetical protein DFH06DRAFT_756897 [Mycena polygramma]
MPSAGTVHLLTAPPAPVPHVLRPDSVSIGMQAPSDTPLPSPSPLDQCLLNSDLLEEIMGHVSSVQDQEDLKAARRSLFSMARTCTAFSPSAVKFLWRRLDNLSPLLHLLPCFRNIGHTYALFGAIEPHQWLSFDRHASFVQEIIYKGHSERPIIIDPSVYVRLAMRGSTVLPNLAILACAWDLSASEIVLYLNSPLRVVKFLGLDTEIDHDILLSMLKSKAPDLSTLVLLNRPSSMLLDGLLPQSITSLELRGTVGTFSGSFLAELGTLPNLTSLVTDLMGWPAVSGTRPSFKELTHLQIYSMGGLVPILDFLRKIAAPHISFFGLHCGQVLIKRWTTEASNDLYHLLAARWHTSLRGLHLEFTSRIANNHLQILRRLSTLRTLKLECSIHPSALHDIVDLATGCPDLQLLSIGTPASPIIFTLPLITKVVRKCPRLQELNIGINVTNLPGLSSGPTISHNLAAIIVISPHIPSDNVTMARYLDKLFPRINTIRHVEKVENDCSRAWAEVQKLMFIFQDIRNTALLQSCG